MTGAASKQPLVLDLTDVGTQTAIALLTSPIAPSLTSPTLMAVSRASTSTSHTLDDGTAPPPYTPPSETFLHTLFERYVPPLGLAPLAKRSPLLYSLIESTAGFAMYTLSIYLFGVLTGAVAFPARHHHYTAGIGDDALWAVYNVRGGACVSSLPPCDRRRTDHAGRSYVGQRRGRRALEAAADVLGYRVRPPASVLAHFGRRT
jgi:hypothetical protein